MSRILRSSLIVGLLTAAMVSAQDYAAPVVTPAQMDSLVSRIALYPDPLLAQVLAAATFPDQIQSAAQWADANRNLSGPDLSAAIAGSNLPFDPSVQALLPFPSVLDMMAGDMNWTAALGDAVVAQRNDVMDAVQRMRQLAWQYGYLADNSEQQVIGDQGAIEILPADPDVVYVPVYDPSVVYVAPRPGFVITTAIRFPFRCPVGGVFLGWNWGGAFQWHSHLMVVHDAVWQRNAMRSASTPGNFRGSNNYARPGINRPPDRQPQITPQASYNAGGRNNRTFNPAPPAYNAGNQPSPRQTFNRPIAPMTAPRPTFDRPVAPTSAPRPTFGRMPQAPAMGQRPAAPPRVEQRAPVSQARQFMPAPQIRQSSPAPRAPSAPAARAFSAGEAHRR